MSTQTARTRNTRARLIRFTGAALTALLVLSGLVAEGQSSPAQAADGASISLEKEVNGQSSVSDIRPGSILSYKISFQANDDDADGPVLIHDKLPEEFAGWQIVGLSAQVDSAQTGLTLDLPGVTSGQAPATPVSGVLPLDPEELNITLSVALPVFAGVGNDSGMGLPVTSRGVLEYTLIVPSDIGTDDPILRQDLVNTATMTANAGIRPLARTSSATVQIDNPVLPKVEATKQWVPAAQDFIAGEQSTIQLAATQTSTIDVDSITLRDPADPGLAPDGALSLPAGNPFNFVDFAGFTPQSDPTANVPAGVETVNANVYRFDGGVWNWVPWDATIPNDSIAGVQLTYASSNGDIAPGTQLGQNFHVEQRATHRSSGESLHNGWSVDNSVLATVQSGDNESTATANKSFEVVTKRVDVQATKGFYTLPDGTPQQNLSNVAAGETIGVVVRATNREEPYSTTLDALTITEPETGSAPEYFGENLTFAGFDNATTVWPTGSTGASLTWHFVGGGTSTVQVPPNGPLPAAPAGQVISKFELRFEGSIAPAAEAIVRYKLDTNGSPDFVPDGQSKGPYVNKIAVTGAAPDLDDKTVTTEARLSLVAPSITLTVNKKVGPQTVLMGQDVFVQLDTTARTGGASTKPTEIILQDSWDESGDLPNNFWDAFDAKQVLPPITRPLGGEGTPTQSELKIYLRDGSGAWGATPFQTNPSETQAINLPANTTGIRFVYSHDDGFPQTTLVKPNLKFTARNTLRSSGEPTAGKFEEPVTYENVVLGRGKAKLGDREVWSPLVADKEPVNIRGNEGDTGPIPGGDYDVWASKSWAEQFLTSQSDVVTSSTQNWAVVTTGIPTVTLQDPATVSASGEGTVFEAFNLMEIFPIKTSGPAGPRHTVDPRLKWDTVTAVQLFDGQTWHTVPAPAGTWMNGDGGFVGYRLDAQNDEHLTTVGMRLILEENSVARQAAAAEGDITAPVEGSGIASSADVRSFGMEWQLRSAARTNGYQPGTPPKWVREDGTIFNCDAGDFGCVRNQFAITGASSSTREHAIGQADINLIDTVTNVQLDKQIRAVNPTTGQPTGSLLESLDLTVPNPGEVTLSNYPRAQYSLSAINASTAPEVPEDPNEPDEPKEYAKGEMALAKVRVADTKNPSGDPVLIGESQFANRNFLNEAGLGSNPFAKVNITKVSFATLPEYIDREQSEVEVWTFDGSTPAGMSTLFTLQEVLDNDPAFLALLPTMIGVSTTFSGTDPEVNGNRIPVGAKLTMLLDVQLRSIDRATGQPIHGGDLISAEHVDNIGVTRGWDAVIAPNDQPRDTDEARIVLKSAIIGVKANKTIAVIHGNTRNLEIYETETEAPVRVSLAASSAGSTAPIGLLRIEDETPGFWEKFRLESLETATPPRDADQVDVQLKVAGAWVPAATVNVADYPEVVGVAVEFSRSSGNQLFPDGSASWSTSWGAAALPFTVKLRDDVVVDWTGDSQDNTVRVTATNPSHGEASDEVTRTVNFGPGTHGLTVEKRAPNENDHHRVDPLVPLPWKLVFTNTGNSYLPIEKVVDSLPSTLKWDWELPTYTSTPGPKGQGLTTDQSEIGVMVSDIDNSIAFTWPEGQRMMPGESMTITLKLALDPLPSGTHGVNRFTVFTGVDLASCVQPKHGATQEPQAPEKNQCSNNNYVTPQLGTATVSLKASAGEITETLGEYLVPGATSIEANKECSMQDVPFVPNHYKVYPCVSYTAPGATDGWILENINIGTNPLDRMVIVDMLPRPGDRLLGNANRGSTFRPVLAESVAADNFVIDGLPPGGSWQVDVTTQVNACIGSGPGSAWEADPSCSDTVTTPENQWTHIDQFTGNVADIAGARFTLDMTATPLKPAERVRISYRTVNVVDPGAAEALLPELASFASPQYAYNQSGIIAYAEGQATHTKPRSLQRTGVVVKTADLVISKDIRGPGAKFAPEEFEVKLSCTIPSGDENEPRIALDMGAYETVTLTAETPVTVPNLPIGANCTASEEGAFGEYGETGRSIDPAPGVTPAPDGLSAEIRIRDENGPSTALTFANTYTVAGLSVQKVTVSNNSHPVSDAQQRAEYGFELSCVANGLDEPITAAFTVQGGALRTHSNLPEGARCTVTETNTGGALATTMTVAGQSVDGTTSGEIVIPEGGVLLLVSNQFEGVATPLSHTGWSGTMPLATLAALLLLGAGLLTFEVRKRARKRS